MLLQYFNQELNKAFSLVGVLVPISRMTGEKLIFHFSNLLIEKRSEHLGDWNVINMTTHFMSSTRTWKLIYWFSICTKWLRMTTFLIDWKLQERKICVDKISCIFGFKMLVSLPCPSSQFQLNYIKPWETTLNHGQSDYHKIFIVCLYHGQIQQL